jgi:hypothetical protein
MQQNLGHVLNRCPPTVHAQHGAVDIGGVVAGEETTEAALDVGIESLRGV